MKRTEVSFELPEGLSTQRAAGYLLYKTLINGPRKGTEVKKTICDTLGMKYCGTVIQHHVKLGTIIRKYPDTNKKNVIYSISPTAGRSYARKKFGLLSDNMQKAIESQRGRKAAKISKTPETV